MGSQFFSIFKKEFALFDEYFKRLIESDFSVFKNISDYIFSMSGKKTRPLLLFYTHKIFSQEVEKKAYLSAALIEIIHSVSLLHDDVVDEAKQRRGKPSASALWGNEAVVLAGDYMLANSFLRAFDDKDDTLMQMLIQVVKDMSEGELLQIQYNILPTITEQQYFEIIDRKTAGLFSCCCRAGAYTAGASKEQIEIVSKMGRELGLAFQIKDDLTDVNPAKNDGKPYGQDIREKKINLPTLYFIEQATESEKEEISHIWESADPPAYGMIEKILAAINSSNAVPRCREKIKHHYENAISMLSDLNVTTLPPQIRNFFSFISVDDEVR
ncbi:MAG: polyprenyl synthetase family protein [Bacteroidales bacterium]|jgi:octaprenyl-diphosphate synthase|nr:polyprenyl synthetase family protein [Bacteroidales bacterium]